MQLSEYLARKRRHAQDAPARRDTCAACRQPRACCYCAQLERFATPMKFVILPHPKEALNRTATGRMAHLCLEDSLWIPGVDYSRNRRLQAVLDDPGHHCVLLYPGDDAVDLSESATGTREPLAPEGKRLVVIVIDGTWQTSRKTLRRSPNLRSLPRICFTPRAPSRFAIRRQPHAYCYTTCEAIHETITLLGPEELTRQADVMLRALDWMVQRELEFRSGVRIGRCEPYRPTSRPAPPDGS